MKLRYILLLFFSIFAVPKLHSQFTKIDNARIKVYTSETDKEKLAALIVLSKFRNSLSADSIYFYSRWMKKLAAAMNDKKSMLFAEYNLLTGDLVIGKTDSVIYKIANHEIFKNAKATDTTTYYKLQFLKANALNRLNKRTEALELQLKILNEAEKERNINTQLFALNFIGATYLNVNQTAEAKKTWLQALSIIKAANNPENEEIEAYILSNLALCFSNYATVTPTKEISDSFFTITNKTIALSQKNENMGVLASILSLRANFYSATKQFSAAEKDITAAIEIRKKIGDPLYIANDYIALAAFYLSQKKYTQCITASREGLMITGNSGIKGEEQLQLINTLAKAYKASGNFEAYGNTLEQFITEADKNNQLNSADKIADIQTKYEVQKKETLIARQKLDLFQRKLLLYSAAAGTLLLLAVFGWRFARYKQKQKLLMEEKRKQHELAIKDAEEKERKRIAAELHDNLGVQANAILHNSSLLHENNSENKAVVTDLQDTAKEMLHNLRETLWAMKTADVTATDLWLRIINFMKQMGRHYTSIHFKVEGEAPGNYIIPSNKALNIVLIVQEAVNNAVKHALPGEITAVSITDDKGWSISLTDNGKGFHPSSAQIEKSDSYGLGNMRERATASAIALSINSEAGKGTRVTLSF